MRDPGLNEAIHAVGSVSELARKIGISQPSVSNWPRVPAERVVSVESASGVHRSILRPDLYGEDIATGEVDEIDMARAEEYGLLATLLSRAPDKKLLGNLSKLRGDVTPMGVVHAAVRKRLRVFRSTASSVNFSISSSASAAEKFFLTRLTISPAFFMTGRLHVCGTTSVRWELRAPKA